MSLSCIFFFFKAEDGIGVLVGFRGPGDVFKGRADGFIYRHAFVSTTVLDGMMRVQLVTGFPILSVVLTPHHFQEVPAHMTFFTDHFVQKGQEAAKAAIQTLNSFAELQMPTRMAS